MLTNRYMANTKNLPKIMHQIIAGTAPKKFTIAHLKSLGFKSSHDLAVIPLLKDLKFLSPDGTPLQRYHDYRDSSRSRQVLGEALREAYEDLFQINEELGEKDRDAVKGRFKSTHNVEDGMAANQTRTFFVLLGLSDTSTNSKAPGASDRTSSTDEKPEAPKEGKGEHGPLRISGLHYNIEIHLPATKDIEVFNAIFKALRQNLGGQ